ncbi:probable nucleolar protein 5-1 isoform X3 [Lolium perenne]|uniref:probable nucleolar protein 5-1 isoform X3 n=1 Tax=Lolium perenne TaxID=4522 RepID=UPI0021F50900|nr:probable nucleolar protein 5-1 isoform X3 [Lolium perenne]
MASKPTRIGKYYYKIPGTVKLLFETPSGFAIFSFDEKYLKKSIEHIWVFFVGNYWHKNIVWLHEFRAFEDKPNVFNLTAQTIDVSLVKMLGTHCGLDETLVVGSRGYKDIIEKRMGLKCLFDDAVKEVMWGLQNLMHTLVPQEQSKITKDDRLPMSLGLNMVLNRYKINVTQEMLNEYIIKKTSKVYATDLREKAHLKFLHRMFDEDFKEFSKVDSTYWTLSKFATALKIMFDPDGALKFDVLTRRAFND